MANPFTRGNSVTYLANERFAGELIRTIRLARDYHVLWIHDIKGGPSADEPDTVSARLVLDAYLPALTRAVRAFDQTGKIPTFLIFLEPQTSLLYLAYSNPNTLLLYYFQQ